MKTNQHSSWLKHALVCLLAFFALSGNAFSQNLLTTSYAASSGWYTTASNCTLDTLAGSASAGSTRYYSTTSPFGQLVGTRGTTTGLAADGTSPVAGTNNTNGKYFEFKLYPPSSFYSLSVTSVSLSAFVNGTASTGGAVLYSTDGGTTWNSTDSKSITTSYLATPTAGAGSVMTASSGSVGAVVTFSKSLTATINFGSFLQVRFIPMRAATSTASSTMVISNVTIGGTVNSTATAPVLTTTKATSVTNTTATVGGNISSDGGATVTRRGVVYSTSSITDTTSTTGGGKIINGSTGIGSYTASLSGLTQNTLYHVKAFALNSAGITYGADSSFTTTNVSFTVPSINTTTASSITSGTASTGGDVSSDGNATVIRRGLVYSTGTITDTTSTTGGGLMIDATGGTGTFTTNLSGLTSATLYHIRAFAVNSVGISYGSDITFTTLAIAPTVTTTAASAILSTSASSGGNVTSDGGATVTRRGLIYSTASITDTSSITGGGKIINSSTGVGSFTSSLTGLAANTLYHIRAFAVNSIGVSYGSDLTFNTTNTAIVIFSTATTTTWTAPCGVTSIQVEAWGGGGAGGGGANGTGGKAGGGGAGGGYVKNTTLSVVPGTTYTITVGAGGTGGSSSGSVTSGNASSFSGSGITSVVAAGGNGGGWGNSTNSGTAGVGLNGTNSGYSASFNYAGGNGAAAVNNSYSGAGGGAAGAGGIGGDASTSAQGIGNGGGNGANGITNTAGGTGVAGSAPGGGGSGGIGTSTLTKNGGKGGDGQIIITYTLPTIQICAAGTLNALSTTFGIASSADSFTVSGSALTANISVVPPAGFEIATAIGGAYSTSLSLTQTSGTVNQTKVYIRLAAATAVGTYSGNVVLSSTGATSVNVATVSSTVNTASPILTASPTSISFGATVAGTPTSATTITVVAANLTSNITIDAPAGYEVSLSNAPFSALTLPYSSFSSSGGTVYLRFNPSIGGSYNYSASNGVSFTATGASTQYINVTGSATSAEPTTASTVSFGTVTASSMVINFTGGNGSNRIVVVKPLTAVSYTPTDGTAVTGVNNDFTLATDQGATGNRVVYDGTGNTVTVTNLPPGLYYIAVIEYNTAGSGTQNYLTSVTGTANTYTLTTSGYTSYPVIGDTTGGFESHATGNMIAGSSSATALNVSTWTTNTNSTITRTTTTTGGRSGPKYVTFGPNGSSSTKTMYSPQISDIVLPNKTYQVQFYYRNTNSSSPATMAAQIYADNTSFTGTGSPIAPGTVQSTPVTLTNSVSSWTKYTTSITTNTTVAPTTKNVFGIALGSSTPNVYPVDFDDYVIYESSTVDNTAPNSPASVNASGNAGSITVNWTAPAGGIDGGGYMVVRYSSNPDANDDPLQNGIYAVGNTITGSVAGIVRYIGTGTSFTDNVNIVGAADYYYKVYAIDKAYNYSAETQYGPVQSLITTYYYAGTGSLATVSNWGTNPDGTGTAPVDFTTDAQIFKIVNTAAVTTDVPWTVSGASSKIILGNATSSAVELTIASGAKITGSLDIAAASSGANSLVLNDGLPVIGTCDANSEVHIRTSLASANAGTYGKLFIENNATDSLTGTPSIKNLTIESGATLISGTATGNYIIIPSGGSVVINGKIATPKTPGLASSNVTTPGTSFATLQFAGTANITLGSGSTVEFSKVASSTTQLIDSALSYANLTLSGTSPKQFRSGTFSVSGNFSITSTGTLTQPSATSIVLNGSSSQSIPSQLTTFSNLSVCGGPKTMSASASVTGILNLNCGIIQTGASTLTVTSTGSVTRTSGWVYGNLKKNIAAGTNVSKTFEIGDATNYAPLAITFSSVTAAGDLVATTGSPLSSVPNYNTMPLIATASTYIDRYWSISNANTLAFSNYKLALTFASNDAVNNATSADVKVNYYSSSWQTLTPTFSGNTDSLSGLTSLGNFTLVSPCTVYDPSVEIVSNKTAVCTGSSVTFTATPTQGGSAPTYQWKKNGSTNIGTGGTTLTLQDNEITTGDVITCVMTANNVCQTTATATSNAIILTVGTVTPSVSITTSNTTICSGDATSFTATGNNGGSSPSFQWKKNGFNAGIGTSITFLPNTLNNNDVISCVLTANNVCQTTATANSNSIQLTVKTSPSIGSSTISTATLCSLGTTTTVYNSNTQGGGVWSSSNPAVATVSTSNGSVGTVTTVGYGIDTLTYSKTSSNGCVSSASTYLSVISPTAPNAITGNNSICKGFTTTLSTTSTGGVWSTASGSIASVNAATGVVTGNSPGVSTIKYTITTGSCSASATYAVTVNQTPTVPSIQYAAGTSNPQTGTGGAFCVGKIFKVVGSPSISPIVAGLTGVWSSSNPAVMAVTAAGSGNNRDTGLVNLIAAGTGSLTYTVTSPAGCVNSRSVSGVTVTTCFARGVNMVDGQQSTVDGITMYPNPAKTFINLNVKTLIGTGSIVVTDLYGKQVKTQALSMGNNTVDIANLSKGFYLVSVITEQGKTTKKLIVE